MIRDVPLADVLDRVIDYRGKTPKKLGGDFASHGVPVLSAIHVKDGRIRFSERARFVEPEMYERWMKEKVRQGDVVLTSEAPLGEVARIVDDSPVVLGQRVFALRADPTVIDAGFLYYCMQSRFVQDQLAGRATGTTVSGIRQSQLTQVRVPLLELDEQVRVAECLALLDALIDLDENLIQQQLDMAVASFAALAVGRASLPLGDLYQVGLSGVWGEDAPVGSATEPAGGVGARGGRLARRGRLRRGVPLRPLAGRCAAGPRP